MTISLDDISHRYRGEYVFSPITHQFTSGSKTVIRGINGSGKSTLIRILSSFQSPTEGKITFIKDSKPVPIESVYESCSICSPAISLEEQFSLEEAFKFHFSFKSSYIPLDLKEFLEHCYLWESRSKKISQLSSGMTQRLKLAFAFFSKSDLLLLDEPCMNLDSMGTDMYQRFLSDYGADRTHIVASNEIDVEFAHCNAEIILTKAK